MDIFEQKFQAAIPRGEDLRQNGCAVSAEYDAEPFLDLADRMTPDRLRQLAASCEARGGGLEVMAGPLRAYAEAQARSTTGRGA